MADSFQNLPHQTRCTKPLGMTDFRFHDLRHETVSRLVESGLSDQEVSAISGHKSMQMLKRYTHLRAQDPVERLDNPTVAVEWPVADPVPCPSQLRRAHHPR
jgi:integrase